MTPSAVLVHGIRTSATMWRAQREHLERSGVPAVAVDLPGHGSRREEEFTLEEALHTVSDAVERASAHGPVVLAGHSMGGLLCLGLLGQRRLDVAAFVGAGCTAFPRGAALRAYRLLARGLDALPGRGRWLSDRTLELTLPPETREDFGAGGYALDAQDAALASLTSLDLRSALPRVRTPTWFVNGTLDQLRVHERDFLRLVPHAELVLVPRTTHLITAMRPRVFNAVLDVAVATARSRAMTDPGESTALV